MKRQSVKMQEKDWQRLEQIASQTGSVYRGRPSWRRLLSRLARGELSVAGAAGSPPPPVEKLPVRSSVLGDDFILSALKGRYL